MKDKDKTQGQLIKELAQLRRRIAELEASGRKRNQFEEALRLERDKAQQYLDIAEVILIALNKKGEITLINRKGNQILGYKEGELLGKNWFTTCVPSRLRKKIKGGFLKLMAGKVTLTEFYEDPALTKSGGERIVAWHNSLLKDALGNPIGTLSSGEDITKRKQAEENLKKINERLNYLHSATSAAIYTAKTSGDYGATSITENVKQITGYEPKEFIEDSSFWLDRVHPEDRQRLLNELPRIFKKGKHTYEYRFLHKDGHYMWVRDDMRLIRDASKKPVEIVGSWIDITERAAATAALRESEEKYRLSFMNVSDVIYTLDSNLTVTTISPSVERALGYKAEEVMNRPFPELNILAPEFLEKAFADVTRVFSGEHVPISIYEFIAKDGTRKIGEVSGSPLYQNGKIVGLISVGRDITDRKRSEVALQESEEHYKTLFDEALVGICLADAETGIIIDCNEAMAALVRRERADLIGKPQKILHPPQNNKEAFSPTFKQHLTKKEGQILETQVVTGTGDIREVEIKANFLDLQGRKVLQGLFHDITERKKAEEALRESETRFRTLFEAIPDTVLVHDDEGTILHINEIGAHRLEWSAKDLVSKNLRAIVTPENRASIADHIRETHKIGWCRFETTYASRSGWQIVAEVNERLIKFGKEKAILSVARDITGRKRTEETLRESEERFRLAFENANTGVCLVDLEGNLTRVNTKMCEIFGYTNKELERMTVNDIAHPEDIDKSPEFIQKTLRGEIDRVTFEKRYFHKNGHVVTCEISSSLVHNAEGAPLYFISHVHDITERKRLQEALDKERDELKLIIDSSPIIVFYKDKDGIFIRVNKVFAEGLKIPPEEFVGKTVFDFYSPQIAQGMADDDQEVLQSGQPKLNIIEQYESASGIRWVQTDKIPIFGIDGIPIGLIGFAQDITERKKTEEALRESEEKYRDLVENINDIIYATDEHGIITYIAPTIEFLSGYTTSEIIGHPFSEFVYQEDVPYIMEKFQQDVSGQSEPHEYRMVNKSGVVRWVRTSSRPLFRETRFVGLRGTMTDITERKQAEEEAIRGYEQLRETLHATVNALASTVEMKDQYTAGHQPRVTQLACAIAAEMGLSNEQIEGIRMAASIHDIGKIVVPAEILNKPGPLTEIQYEMVKMHPRAGFDVVKEIKFPWPVAQIVLQHHERMDGSGYPQGLSGADIILEARILAVADIVEAIATHRPYRPARGIGDALEEILHNKGIFYDPDVVDACLRVFYEKGFKFE